MLNKLSDYNIIKSNENKYIMKLFETWLKETC